MSQRIQIPMTPAQFTAKAAELKAEQGIELTLNAGTIEKLGVKASYTFDGESLFVDVLQRPLFMSPSMIESKLRQWLAA